MLSKNPQCGEKKKKAHSGFSVMYEELCRQQHTGELKQASQENDYSFLDAQEKQKVRRTQTQTRYRSSALDSDEGCGAAGCIQNSIPHSLSQDKRCTTARGVFQPPRRHGCSPQRGTPLRCFESVGSVWGALGKTKKGIGQRTQGEWLQRTVTAWHNLPGAEAEEEKARLLG